MFKNKETSGQFGRRNNFIQNRPNGKTPARSKYFMMDESEFPNISLKETIQKDNKLNYLDKLTTEEKVVIQGVDELKPGWIEIKYDSTTRIKTINYAKPKKNYPPVTNNEEEPYIVMLNELSDKYIRWKNAYIEKWGEHEYESLYLFPNCDSNYFEDCYDDLVEEEGFEQDYDFTIEEEY
jgi:hypothetical protein